MLCKTNWITDDLPQTLQSQRTSAAVDVIGCGSITAFISSSQSPDETSPRVCVMCDHTWVWLWARPLYNLPQPRFIHILSYFLAFETQKWDERQKAAANETKAWFMLLRRNSTWLLVFLLVCCCCVCLYLITVSVCGLLFWERSHVKTVHPPWIQTPDREVFL